jgi:hypothetical protein
MRPARPLLALTLLLLAGRPARAVEVMPLSDVRPGMEGVGRTVFEGSRVEEFSVRILGVLENALGPRQSLILARLAGGPLAETGVIAGMSGSPVYVDGRLVGAVAYAFPFGKLPIAGITPFAEMVEATATLAPRAASARLRPGAGLRLDRPALLAALERPLRPTLPVTPGDAALPPGLSGATLAPLSLPLVFSGFDPAAFEWARGVFASMGFAPVAGGSSASRPGPLGDLAPGSAIGVSLVEGDLDLSATGTVTHVDGARVYAFGHPFYNLGPTRFPMKKAWVYSVFPSLQVSWKIAAAFDPVGTIDQDRATAVAGLLGEPPRLVPVEVRLRSPRSAERVFRFRMVDDELFTPTLAYVCLLSVLQGHERALGAATLRVEARLSLAGGRSIRVEEIAASDQPAPQAALAVASPLAALFGNDFERVAVERLDVAVDALETVQAAELHRVWVDGRLPVRAGTTASVRVLLRNRRGETERVDLPVPVPASAPAGSYTLLVSDAATMDAIEQREMRQGLAPRDLPALLRAIERLRSGNRLYARLTRPAGGAVLAGAPMPSLPGSVLSVLGSADQGASLVSLPASPVWQGNLATDRALSGWRQITVPVER